MDDSRLSERHDMGLGGVAFDHGCLPKIVAVHSNEILKGKRNSVHHTTNARLQDYLNAKQKQRGSQIANNEKLFMFHDYSKGISAEKQRSFYQKNHSSVNSQQMETDNVGNQQRIPAFHTANMLLENTYRQTNTDKNPYTQTYHHTLNNTPTEVDINMTQRTALECSGYQNNFACNDEEYSTYTHEIYPIASQNLNLQSFGHNSLITANARQERLNDTRPRKQNKSQNNGEDWQNKPNRFTDREKSQSTADGERPLKLSKAEAKAKIIFLLESAAVAGRDNLCIALDKLLSKKMFKNTLYILKILKSADISETNRKKILSVLREKVYDSAPNFDLWKKDVDVYEMVMTGKNYHMTEVATSRASVTGTFKVPSLAKVGYDEVSKKNNEHDSYQTENYSNFDSLIQFPDVSNEMSQHLIHRQTSQKQIDDRPTSLLHQLQQMSSDVPYITLSDFADKDADSIVLKEPTSLVCSSADVPDTCFNTVTEPSGTTSSFNQLLGQFSSKSNQKQHHAASGASDVSRLAASTSTSSSLDNSRRVASSEADTDNCSKRNFSDQKIPRRSSEGESHDKMTDGEARNKSENNDKAINDETNNDEVNNDEVNNDEVNNDEVNNDEVNNDEVNNDNANHDEANNDEAIDNNANNEKTKNIEVSNAETSNAYECLQIHDNLFRRPSSSKTDANGSLKRDLSTETLRSGSEKFATTNKDAESILTHSYPESPKRIKIEKNDSESSNSPKKDVSKLSQSVVTEKNKRDKPHLQSSFDSGIEDAASIDVHMLAVSTNDSNDRMTHPVDDDAEKNRNKIGIVDKKHPTDDDNDNYDKKVDQVAKDILNQFATSNDDMIKNIFDLLE